MKNLPRTQKFRPSRQYVVIGTDGTWLIKRLVFGYRFQQLMSELVPYHRQAKISEALELLARFELAIRLPAGQNPLEALRPLFEN